MSEQKEYKANNGNRYRLNPDGTLTLTRFDPDNFLNKVYDETIKNSEEQKDPTRIIHVIRTKDIELEDGTKHTVTAISDDAFLDSPNVFSIALGGNIHTVSQSCLLNSNIISLKSLASGFFLPSSFVGTAVRHITVKSKSREDNPYVYGIQLEVNKAKDSRPSIQTRWFPNQIAPFNFGQTITVNFADEKRSYSTAIDDTTLLYGSYAINVVFDYLKEKGQKSFQLDDFLHDVKEKQKVLLTKEQGKEIYLLLSGKYATSDANAKKYFTDCLWYLNSIETDKLEGKKPFSFDGRTFRYQLTREFFSPFGYYNNGKQLKKKTVSVAAYLRQCETRFNNPDFGYAKTFSNLYDGISLREPTSKEENPAIEYMKGRGISKEICNRFHIGYDNDFVSPNRYRGSSWIGRPVVIIPIGEEQNSFLARFIGQPLTNEFLQAQGVSQDSEIEKILKKYESIVKKEKYGAAGQSLFNAAAFQENSDTLVIVEGEIDAMSIYEAAKGLNQRVSAIGLGSTNNAKTFKTSILHNLVSPYIQNGTIRDSGKDIDNFEKLKSILKSDPTKRLKAKNIILSFDTDDSGQKCTKEILSTTADGIGIEELSDVFAFEYSAKPLSEIGENEVYNDPNEALTSNRSGFISQIKNVLDDLNYDNVQFDEYGNEYHLTKNGTLKDFRLKDEKGRLVFPAEVQNIPESFFKGNDKIHSVSFINEDFLDSPKALKIQQNAFQDCKNLEELSINGFVLLELQEDSFSGCFQNETNPFNVSITIEAGCLIIGKDAFKNCSHVRNVDFGRVVSFEVNPSVGCKPERVLLDDRFFNPVFEDNPEVMTIGKLFSEGTSFRSVTTGKQWRVGEEKISDIYPKEIEEVDPVVYKAFPEAYPFGVEHEIQTPQKAEEAEEKMPFKSEPKEESPVAVESENSAANATNEEDSFIQQIEVMTCPVGDKKISFCTARDKLSALNANVSKQKGLVPDLNENGMLLIRIYPQTKEYKALSSYLKGSVALHKTTDGAEDFLFRCEAQSEKANMFLKKTEFSKNGNLLCLTKGFSAYPLSDDVSQIPVNTADENFLEKVSGLLTDVEKIQRSPKLKQSDLPLECLDGNCGITGPEDVIEAICERLNEKGISASYAESLVYTTSPYETYAGSVDSSASSGSPGQSGGSPSQSGTSQLS